MILSGVEMNKLLFIVIGLSEGIWIKVDALILLDEG
jgi:hypothetical protein